MPMFENAYEIRVRNVLIILGGIYENSGFC